MQFFAKKNEKMDDFKNPWLEKSQIINMHCGERMMWVVADERTKFPGTYAIGFAVICRSFCMHTRQSPVKSSSYSNHLEPSMDDQSIP